MKQFITSLICLLVLLNTTQAGAEPAEMFPPSDESFNQESDEQFSQGLDRNWAGIQWHRKSETVSPEATAQRHYFRDSAVNESFSGASQYRGTTKNNQDDMPRHFYRNSVIGVPYNEAAGESPSTQ